MTLFSFINLTVKASGKSRFPGLPVAAGFLICVMMLPARAEKVADGTVNFTGSMLGGTTCTLVDPSLTLDFGTLSVDRGGGIPANPLVPSQTRTFQLTNCASSVHHVDINTRHQRCCMTGMGTSQGWRVRLLLTIPRLPCRHCAALPVSPLKQWKRTA
ncbi:type 1 fimbrial protein [Salmonella enterica subsp. enterica serovar Gatuni]|nr:type 1 fimbrial protein [Salmonella enterica subsp. enterica serovar Gatuni]